MGALPALAVESSDMQSVFVNGGNGHCLSTASKAHASAAAAVSHHSGGQPMPYAKRSPALEITASPKPVALSACHLPLSMEPSQYQVASSMRGSS